MCNLRLTSAVLFAVLATGAANAAQQTSRSFDVTYESGARERVLVKYRGYVASNIERGGKASKPLKGQILDTRYCRWSISTNVVRQVFLVSASGAIAPLTEEQTVTLATDVDRRGPSDIVQAAGYHTTCGDQMALINSQIAGAEQNLAASFPATVKGDATNVERHLKDILKPVRVAAR
jgi:hypothetical protein